MFGAIVALAVVLAPEPTSTVELSRGKDGYYAVQDTFIDQGNPTSAFGRDPLLSAGPGKAVLIRFGNLPRVLGRGAIISKATLRLPLEVGDAPGTATVSRMLVPWGEGPGRRGLDPTAKQLDPMSKPVAPRWASTWILRRGGEPGARWERAGAKGEADAEPIPTAIVTVEGNALVVRGIDAAVQDMIDHPLDNYGFRIEVESPMEFDSSDSLRGRPSLSVSVAPAPASSGPNLAVVGLAPQGVSGDAWPTEGQKVKWVARIANTGDAPAGNYRVVWSWQERRLAAFEVGQAVAPGAETTTELEIPWRGDPADHRTCPLRVAIEPAGPDAKTEDNAYEVAEDGMGLGVIVPESAAKNNALALALRDFAAAMNDEAFATTFTRNAKDGCRERVRIQSIGSGEPDKASHAVLKLDQADVDALLASSFPPSVIAKTLVALGVPSGKTLEAASGAPAEVGGHAVTSRSIDRYPGVLGYGDTRDDSNWMPGIALSDPVWFNPIELGNPMAPQGLLSRTDVALIDAAIGKLGTNRTPVADVPGSLIIRMLYPNGRAIAGAQVNVYQSSGGGFAPEPVAQGATANTGVLLVSGRPSGEGAKISPLGKLNPDLSNSTLLFQVTANGLTESAWVPIWKLWDEAERGNRGAALFDIRLPLCDAPLDATADLALNKVVTDSANRYPAQLQALVDGDPVTSVEMEEPANGWIEVDLGRDRAIGGVELQLAGDDVWEQFDIKVYNTGQKASDARLWQRELSGSFALKARGKKQPQGHDIIYRNPATRVRFVRIELPTGGKATLRGIRVLPATMAPTGA